MDLRSRIIQDCDGDAYYVLREQRVEPKIEVRDYHMELEAFINEQEKIQKDILDADAIEG